MIIRLYTDGSSRGNPGPGGYGVLLRAEPGSYQKCFSEGFRHTTNNRMELLAVIVGLEKIKKPGQEVHIYSDSKYVVDAVSKGWLAAWDRKNFEGKKNPDLWKRYMRVAKTQRIVFHWVKGHNEHPENELCDSLAVKAACGEAGPMKADSFFEKLSHPS